MRAHPAGPRHGDEHDHVTHRPVSVAESLRTDNGVWSANVTRDEVSGALTIADHDVRELTEQFGTPLLVMDLDDLRERVQDYQAAFDDPELPTDIYYAGKAFLSVQFARWLADEGLRIDVCTGGELACALRADVPGADLLFHGNNKSPVEIAEAIDAGVGRIVLDSFEDIARVAFAAEQAGVVAPVLVRVTAGVEAHTHEFIATAHEDQKFGFSLAAGDAREAVARVLNLPSLELRGLHSHIGSQIFDASGFEVACARVIGLMAQLRDEFGHEFAELNLGGGLGIKYQPSDQPLSVSEIARDLREIVKRECSARGLPLPRLAFEPGRAIVGPTTCTLYTVGTIKQVATGDGPHRTYVSVDGGMSDNIRTALYDAEYTVTLASRSSDAELMRCRVVGKHCESGDIVVTDAWLPSDLAVDDVLAVAATGAYNRSMASNYNLVPRPPVIAVRPGEIVPLIRRETTDDLFACDLG